MERGNSKEYALNEEQVVRIGRAIADPKDKAIFEDLVYGGLRAGEMAHMRPHWFKEQDDGIKLAIPARQDCKCKECGKRGYWKPKTLAGIRTIHLPEKTLRLHTDPDVFGKNGFGFGRVSIYNHVKKILKESGVVFLGLAGDTAFPHALRATCATLLASRGASAAAIAYHMGWSDIRVAQKYVDMAQMKAEAHRQTAAIFGR